MPGVDFEKMQAQIDTMSSQIGHLMTLIKDDKPQVSGMINSKEIAKEMGISVHTLRKNYDRFVEKGFPLEKINGRICASRKKLADYINKS